MLGAWGGGAAGESNHRSLCMRLFVSFILLADLTGVFLCLLLQAFDENGAQNKFHSLPLCLYGKDGL